MPALLVALAQATGDLDLLRPELAPNPALIHDPHGGLDRDARAAARALAADAIARLERRRADGDVRPIGWDDDEGLRVLLAFLIGEAVDDEYLDLFREELGPEGRALRWHKDDLAPDRPFHVVVVGAGMSGLAAAHRLRQAGVDVTVFEKNADVGGTWLENRYPGCRVDVPSHFYSYSFVARDDWPQRFSPQPVLLDYFRTCADSLDLRRHIRFETEVARATWRDDEAGWVVEVRDRDGNETSVVADVVVSATGQLNRPRLPDIPGRDSFAGPAFHSARWDHGVDLTGKRVAVIGTAASAIQLVPEVAAVAGHVDVYQRTPNWFMPTPDYHADVSAGMRWLLRHVPTYATWYRLALFWRLAEGALPAASVDPTWDGNGRSVSARNDFVRTMLTQYLEAQFSAAPELLPHVVPDYPPFSKRILLDNGIWASTLMQPHVDLVTDCIDEIVEKGVVAGGVVREVDVIVYATGFHASQFLTPMRVTGVGGEDLHDRWGDDARAYLGMTVPGFPNLFCLYGPNTNLAANGSIIYFTECEVQYLLDAVRYLLERGAAALDCRRDVHDAYNAAVDEANSAMAWGAAAVNSWYRSSSGRITQNWPYSLREFWRRTRRLDPDDYLVR